MIKHLLLLFTVVVNIYASKPQLLLLNTYTDQNITNWVMSEKLDGIRAYWNGRELISRGGKIIHAPSWFTKNYPPFEIDGELWSRRGDFENISSIVRDKIPSDKWKEIKHYIFEVPNAAGGLFERLEKVKPYVSSNLKLIKQIDIKDKKHLQMFLSNIESQDGEGVVVRDPNAVYINKRTSSALKVKTFYESECEVIGYREGKGKYEGLLGSIICKLPNEIEFKIGSGFSDDERKNPPKIGDIVTFKYKEFTKYTKPRFPVFVRVRFAK